MCPERTMYSRIKFQAISCQVRALGLLLARLFPPLAAGCVCELIRHPNPNP